MNKQRTGAMVVRFLISSVRLAARLYPSLTLLASPAGDQCVGELTNLAKAINPNIELRRTGTPDVVLAVGTDAPSVDAPTVYAGCDEWLGFVGTNHRYAISDTGNPFGAGFAACLAAANLFRFLFVPDGRSHLMMTLVFLPTSSPSRASQRLHSRIRSCWLVLARWVTVLLGPLRGHRSSEACT